MEESAVACCGHGHVDVVELVAADVVVALVSGQVLHTVRSDERHSALGLVRRSVLALGEVFERAHSEVVEHRWRRYVGVSRVVHRCRLYDVRRVGLHLLYILEGERRRGHACELCHLRACTEHLFGVLHGARQTDSVPCFLEERAVELHVRAVLQTCCAYVFNGALIVFALVENNVYGREVVEEHLHFYRSVYRQFVRSGRLGLHAVELVAVQTVALVGLCVERELRAVLVESGCHVHRSAVGVALHRHLIRFSLEHSRYVERVACLHVVFSVV